MTPRDVTADTSMTAGKAGGQGPGPHDPRPLLAVVSIGYAPYRVHVLRRVAREIPQIRLATLYTHEFGNAPWASRVPEEVGPVVFGKGESSNQQSMPRYALWNWIKAGRVIRWMRRHSVSVVLVEGYADVGRVRILRWCKAHGIPTLVFGDSNIHGDLRGGWKGRVKRLLVPRFLRHACGILVVGRYGRAYFTKYGCQSDDIFLFANEPDYSLITDLPAEAARATASRLGLRSGRRRIVFSGRIVRDKRPEMLLDAFLQIADHRPEWDLIFVGDGPLRAPLEKRVPPSMKDRVVWCGFLDSQADVAAVYKASDVLVLPSDYEPWALVVNEAAAAGMAIVASSVVGAAAELVRDGVNGRVFPPGDSHALTDCLLDVTDPARADTMKAASAGVLADWRRAADPVHGLRQALRHCGLSVAD
jgi:glycosyltransferase involved in cell wall biosynthesis